MQNSLCGDRGGLRFNIHADLEAMLNTGLGNLHFCLILLLPGSVGQPPAPPPLDPWGFYSPPATGGAGPLGQCGGGLTCCLPWLSWPRSTCEQEGGSQGGSHGEELPELLGHLDGK